jgi:hypothetical protein
MNSFVEVLFADGFRKAFSFGDHLEARRFAEKMKSNKDAIEILVRTAGRTWQRA